MALPTLGQISMGDINVEINRLPDTHISLWTAERGFYGSLNTNSTSRPNGSKPATIGEWRGYNHDASASLTISPTNQIVGAGLNIFTLTITTPNSWTYSDNRAWINTNTTSGTGNSNISISVQSNQFTLSRFGTVSITSGNTTKNCFVSQAASSGGGDLSGGGVEIKCIHPNTLISLEDNNTKMVKDLLIGDIIKSIKINNKPTLGFNLNNSEDVNQYLNWNDYNNIPLSTPTTSKVIDINIKKYERVKDINNGQIITSLLHPFLVEKQLLDGKRAWTVRNAFDIREGDTILDGASNRVKVNSAEEVNSTLNLYEVVVEGEDAIITNNIITLAVKNKK